MGLWREAPHWLINAICLNSNPVTSILTLQSNSLIKAVIAQSVFLKVNLGIKMLLTFSRAISLVSWWIDSRFKVISRGFIQVFEFWIAVINGRGLMSTFTHTFGCILLLWASVAFCGGGIGVRDLIKRGTILPSHLAAFTLVFHRDVTHNYLWMTNEVLLDFIFQNAHNLIWVNFVLS